MPAVSAITPNGTLRTQLERELNAIENERPLINVSELGQLPASVGRAELMHLVQTYRTLKRTELGALSDSLLLNLLQDQQREIFNQEQKLNADMRSKAQETRQLSNASTFVNGLSVAGSIAAGAAIGGPAGMAAVAAGLFNAGRLVAENTGVYRHAAESLTDDAGEQKELEQTLASGAQWIGTGLSVGTAFCGGWGGLKEATSSLFQQTSQYGTVLGSVVQGYLGFQQARVSAAHSNLWADQMQLRGVHTSRELEVEESYASLSDHLAKERQTFEMLSQAREAVRDLDFQILEGV